MILHRDISADNIVIDIVTGRGVLVDWDHSVGRDDDSGSGRVVRDFLLLCIVTECLRFMFVGNLDVHVGRDPALA